jgi:hypothetical protein
VRPSPVTQSSLCGATEGWSGMPEETLREAYLEDLSDDIGVKL